MTTPKLALVTGGRDFIATAETWPAVIEALADVVLVVHGGAPGFDEFIAAQAGASGLEIQPCPAYWALARRLGAPVGREGPMRNKRMHRWGLELAEVYRLDPVLIAGPGGTGTAGMRKICAGIPVREVPGRLE